MATSSAHEGRLDASSSRERNQSNRAEQNSSPATLRTAASFSVANQTLPGAQPLSVEALLSTYCHASQPSLAALEVSVSERNTFALQNTQLWKLIEKQRSGYGQLMKELERVRGERDLYRSRLQVLGENTDALLRAHRDKEKRDAKEGALRSSSSHSHLRSSESGSSHVVEPRAQVVRMNSADTAVRGSHQLNHQHSQDQVSRAQPNLREQYSSQASLNIPSSSSHTSSTIPSPLSAYPASSVTSLNLSSNPREDTPEGYKITGVVASPTQERFAPTARPLAGSPTASTSSLNQQQSAIAGTSERADPVLGHWQSGSRPSLDATRPAGQIVLTPAPPAQSAVLRDSSPARLHPTQRQPSPEKPPPASTASLSPAMNGDTLRNPHALSRESRISLPEEAKRYYANLGESPVPSPSIGGAGFPSGSGQPSPVRPQMSRITEASESMRSYSGTPSVATSSERGSGDRVRKSEEGAPFLDMGDEDSVYSGLEGGRSSNIEDGDESSYDREGDKRAEASKSAIAEDFPLPPSTPAFSAGQGRTAADLSINPSQPGTPVSPFPMSAGQPQMKFRALPLLATDLPRTEVRVLTSTIRPNERGKEVVSFVIYVNPGNGKGAWNVEKLYSDVLGLDARMRANVSKSVLKKMAPLPEGRLWKDHAPAKVDQRKSALELYLRSLIALPVKNKDEIIAFFTSDIVREAQKPVLQAGYKEGYLTKRGKNFGGWKSRYFVLQGPSLEYYESRGGTHLGSITITGAQIGRQQRALDRRDSDEDNDYRHAFLIIEAKRGPGGSSSRHVLCADSDEERDSWVEELVRYVTGTYSEDQVAVLQYGPSPIIVGSAVQNAPAQPRSSSSSNPANDIFGTPNRRPRDVVQNATTPNRAELTNGKAFPTDDGSASIKSAAAPSPIDHVSLETPLSSSLPAASPLVPEDVDVLNAVSQRANSELGHYPDLVGPSASYARPAQSPEASRKKGHRISVTPLKAAIPERTPSPEKDAASLTTPRVDSHGKVKISAPMNGTPIPAGYKFGGTDAPTPSSSERREKAKSRGFWAFGRHEKPSAPVAAPRAVFGIPLEESLDVAQIASLPAIVFRCIQYLEDKKAEQEEGIYRLSGSSAVIKSLKDRFNAEGDIDLLSSDEYWDPHAIAGLLKTFLRDLPASILTRDLHLRFLSVIDFADPQERIRELSHLIAALPIANYSLLRALTAHLILIVQNAHVNKMTMKNVGIVFSPTLGIPAGVFSLMMGEFTRVFNVDGILIEDEDEPVPDGEAEAGIDRRNSRRYTDAAADELLGLSGRELPAADDGPSSEGEEAPSVIEESTEGSTENESEIVESSATSSTAHLLQGAPASEGLHLPEPNGGAAPMSPASRSSRAAHLAASRGLNISVSDKVSHRHSRVVGLLPSPRPSPRATQGGAPSPTVPSPLVAPR